MADLPEWFEPLLTRIHSVEASDFTRLPTPDGEGYRQSAVLILFGEDPATGPDVLVLQRAATMRNHAGQPAFPGGRSTRATPTRSPARCARPRRRSAWTRARSRSSPRCPRCGSR